MIEISLTEEDWKNIDFVSVYLSFIDMDAPPRRVGNTIKLSLTEEQWDEVTMQLENEEYHANIPLSAKSYRRTLEKIRVCTHYY